MSPDEARRLLAEVPAAHRLVVALLYGAGLRLMEALTLRVTDVDLARRRIHVRDGKGAKARFTVLPEALCAAMGAQLDRVRRAHRRDIHRGGGHVVLPDAFGRKSPAAERNEQWLERRYLDAEELKLITVTPTPLPETA